VGQAESDLETTRVLAADARQLATAAGEIRIRYQGRVESLAHGGAIVADGFAFPIAGPHAFADTFGAPRMTGTPYEHKHQGTDVFAPYGASLRAMERGVVVRMGADLLGGTKLWLVGATGTRYYYAHLSGYAPGIADGMVVEAGAELGYVGKTGNARTTPPHLHIELHPGGGAAINPYPLLKALDDAVNG
jgi:murein DD-endopeptidase MepM/ murein hydrolase activator NlpD